MALATRCPHCQTAFRVASDQLKLRAGLVRCGTCKEIFNGIENLLHPDEDIVAATAAPTPPIPTFEEAVVTTKHVRGDETRFNDLIAEVDHPFAPRPAAPPAWPPMQADRQFDIPATDPPAATAPAPVQPPAQDAAHDRLWAALEAPLDGTGARARTETPNAAAAERKAGAGAMADDDAVTESATDADHLLANAQDAAEPLAEEAALPAARDDRHDSAHESAHQEAHDKAHDHVPDQGHDHAHHQARDTRDDAREAADIDAADALPQDPDSPPAHDADGEPNAAGASTTEDDAPALPHLLRAAAVEEDSSTSQSARPSPAPARMPRKIPTPAAPAIPAPSLGELADRLPDFIRDDEEREDRHRTRRPLLVLAAVLLGAALLVQGVYTARTTLAANFPALRPLLDAACNLAGCSVGLPMQIDSVSIESSDFQPLPGRPDQFLLSVLLRNRSATVQAWPTVELTLNDATDKAVGRRLIAPRDYLPAGQTAVRGFSAGSEQALRLVFDLSRLKASGYRVYVFYP